MAEQQPFPPGRVEWSGHNPNMFLKDSEDGPFVSLVSFFRVFVSPQGAGQGVIVLETPDAQESRPDALNVCLTDNEAMARWLVAEFITTFPPFRERAGLRAMAYHRLTGQATRSDIPRAYTEELRGEGLEVSLSWEELGEPFMVDVPPEKSTTGRHEMFSLFLDAHRAVATVNGRRLRGASQPRDFNGRRSTTAFLAFSETWLRP